MDHQSFYDDKKKLRNAVILRFSLVAFIMAFLLFFSAGSIRYWQAWVYWGTLVVPMIFFCAYFLKNNPALLERRMRMKEKEKSQKILIKTSFVVFIAVWVLPGLDYRFHWSSVPTALSLATDAFVLAGYLLCFFVMKENEYASRIIEVERGQKVISTGPYAYVRHPLYSCGSIIYLFSPLALGSFWTMYVALLIPVIFIIRLLHEESFLKKELKGYAEYMQKVKYRLIPYIW
ncbi:MAG: isoprenylcysteine carboxylmethyltransferase family protein [Bdellovibrionales bacterium]